MGKYVAETVVIASIYPGTLDSVVLPHGPTMKLKDGRATRYALEPVPRERLKKPFLLEVSDGYESVPNPVQSNGNQIAMSPRPVDANEIADFLVQHWAANLIGMPPGVTPGIMRIRGSVPHQDELAELERRQTSYAEFMFEQGEILVFERKIKWITQPMRDSAVWLKRPRNWVNQTVSDREEPCPFCKKLIPIDAYVCQGCSRIVRKIPDELNFDTPAKVPTMPAPAVRPTA